MSKVKPMTATGRRLLAGVPPVVWDAREILDVEREAFVEVLYLMSYPSDMRCEPIDAMFAADDALILALAKRYMRADVDGTGDIKYGEGDDVREYVWFIRAELDLL